MMVSITKNNGLRLVPPLGNVHLVFYSIIKALHLLCSVHIFQRLIKQRKQDRMFIEGTQMYYTMYVREYYIRVDSGEDDITGGSAHLVQAAVSH